MWVQTCQSPCRNFQSVVKHQRVGHHVRVRVNVQLDRNGVNHDAESTRHQIHSFSEIVQGLNKGFDAGCQPEWMHEAFRHAADEEQTMLLSTAICTEQCDDLLAEGVDHLHFYTLNNPELTYGICRALGMPTVGVSMAARAVA